MRPRGRSQSPFSPDDLADQPVIVAPPVLLGPPGGGGVLALSVPVLLSSHVVFAIHGVATLQQTVSGWSYWFDPPVLALINYPVILGMAGCTWLCHSGGADAGTLTGILTSGVWGTRR